MLNFHFSFGQFKNSSEVCFIRKQEKMNLTICICRHMMWKISAEDCIA